VKIFGGRRRGREIVLIDGGEGDFDLRLSAMRAEMSGGGKMGEIVMAARAGFSGLDGDVW